MHVHAEMYMYPQMMYHMYIYIYMDMYNLVIEAVHVQVKETHMPLSMCV